MLDSWPLAWRFDNLPSLASRIQILDRDADKQIRNWIRRESPVAVDFHLPDVVAYDMERNPEEDGIAFLTTLLVDSEEVCTIVWAGPFLSCRMMVGDAFRNFYDVWYPGSDDLWVIPDSRGWFLECDHHGYLRFVPAMTDGD